MTTPSLNLPSAKFCRLSVSSRPLSRKASSFILFVRSQMPHRARNSPSHLMPIFHHICEFGPWPASIDGCTFAGNPSEWMLDSQRGRNSPTSVVSGPEDAMITHSMPSSVVLASPSCTNTLRPILDKKVGRKRRIWWSLWVVSGEGKAGKLGYGKWKFGREVLYRSTNKILSRYGRYEHSGWEEFTRAWRSWEFHQKLESRWTAHCPRPTESRGRLPKLLVLISCRVSYLFSLQYKVILLTGLWYHSLAQKRALGRKLFSWFGSEVRIPKVRVQGEVSLPKFSNASKTWYQSWPSFW